ncbi:hypothetical protein N339_04701, partial [Pterocles gutturalis]
SQQKGLVTMEERGTFHTTSSYQICHFGAMLWDQQRGCQTPHLLSYHTADGPKQSIQLTTWLNTTGEYKYQRLEEFELSGASLCVCAV